MERAHTKKCLMDSLNGVCDDYHHVDLVPRLPIDRNRTIQCRGLHKKKLFAGIGNKEMENIKEIVQTYPKEGFFIYHLGGYERVLLEEILYMKAENVYTVIVLDRGKRVTASLPLSRFEPLLDDRFLRTHRSSIVNLEKINYINVGDASLTVENGVQLPYSLSNKGLLFSRLNVIKSRD